MSRDRIYLNSKFSPALKTARAVFGNHETSTLILRICNDWAERNCINPSFDKGDDAIHENQAKLSEIAQVVSRTADVQFKNELRLSHIENRISELIEQFRTLIALIGRD